MLPKEPFRNCRSDITDEKDDYTIYYYVSQHFSVLIVETWTCLTWYAQKPKVLKYDSFIKSLEEISHKGKN